MTGSEIWLRSFHDTDSQNPTECVVFPHAGGSASYYHPLSAALCADTRVRIVQYPGRQDRRREPPLRSIAELVAGVLPEFETVPGQVVLFGHSMGAVVAFEVAKALSGTDPARVAGIIVSGRRAPRPGASHQPRQLTDSELVESILTLSSATRKALADPEIRAATIPALRADYWATESYVLHGDATVDCPISAFCGARDGYAGPELMSDWRNRTTADFTMREFPGGHFYFEEEFPNFVESVRKDIRRWSELAEQPDR